MSRHACLACGAALWGLFGLLRPLPAAEQPTHAAVEIYASLLEGLARAADFPYRMVAYDGGEAARVLPEKGRWEAGEYGHLRKLDLFLESPEDVTLLFEAQPVTATTSRPMARLQMALRGPAEAEWWSKLPLQREWGRVKRFERPIVLRVQARAQVVAGRGESGNACVSLAFERIEGRDVELNVRGCPPWLDRLIETQFNVAEQVNVHVAQAMAPRTRIELPSLTVPYLDRPLAIEDLRPTVRNGVLRLELTLGAG
ncbi:MAG: hypothetical protein FJX74_25085 [Armatimonadetes bacterium]|nr:hypothetical protein [Armatimonadota bacterium]